MLKQIHIQNYALIENLKIDFNAGYSVITGETGAGKSILLGALSLILGNRADTGILKDKEQKCVVEAEFDIQRFSLKVFYDKYDIDYDELTIIRREISPSGRSRAFINDTPVNLSVLKDLSVQLTDIHSQHQNLHLNDNSFQLNVLDAYAGLKSELEDYKKDYFEYLKIKKEYKQLIERAEKEKKDYEFLQFQFEELEKANLKAEEQKEIEAELKQLNHAGEIIESLTSSFSVLSDEDAGVVNNLRLSISSLKQIQSFFEKANSLNTRLESAKIEIEDIANELEILAEDVEHNPERAEFLKERIDIIYSLQNKHKVSSVEELISIKDNLQLKLDDITSFDGQISEMKENLSIKLQIIENKADVISKSRAGSSKKLEDGIIDILQKLGMPSAKFKVKQENTESLTETGKDKISFLFSANKHSEPQEISNIASGGEISRLMLAIKSVISDTMALPVIIFDEIDTGVSGDIAEKIGNIMKAMSENMQVISITHLPQVASRADFHFKVYKVESERDTQTNIVKLTEQERINELATMLSGENITDAALKNAEELLK